MSNKGKSRDGHNVPILSDIHEELKIRSAKEKRPMWAILDDIIRAAMGKKPRASDNDEGAKSE